jgi:hypothetical protein
VHSCGARVFFDIAPVASENACVAHRFVAVASRFDSESYRIVSDASVLSGVASRVGRVVFDLGTVASGAGTFLFLARRAAPLSGRVALVHLLDAIVPVGEIDVGARVDDHHHRVAQLTAMQPSNDCRRCSD